MDVLYVTHSSFEEHHPGEWHPERPARLKAAERGVLSSGLAVRRMEAPAVTPTDLERVHPAIYIDSIRRLCEGGGGAIDDDTAVSPGSYRAAIHAAGAAVGALDHLREAPDSTIAFCSVRPPGHHAMERRAMGFCLFNNVVVAARRLVVEGERVAIVDFDVHHGNGTQDLTADDPDIFYASIHQAPFYPFAGEVWEVGEGSAVGTVLNVPLPAFTGGDVYRTAMGEVIVPALTRFRPDWLLISAGFDAHENDPLAEMRLVDADYQAMTRSLNGLVPVNRTIVLLEGGYHLPAITGGVAATLRGLAGEEAPDSWNASPQASWEALEKARISAKDAWSTREGRRPKADGSS